MVPDFNKATVDTLAKRASFKCSNPDCRVNTVGPNADPKKSTLIGEAAHIYGARVGSKRYNSEMTDVSRAQITNAIWLCRNCHKLIDADEQKYSSDILFTWRELHEEYILSELGSATDKINFEDQHSKLSQFKDYPPIIRRIIIDKPDGWEFMLTAELMRFLNKPMFRKIKDLRDGLYIKTQGHVEGEEAINWIRKRLTESTNLVKPLVTLLDRLSKSWGDLGESGDVEEIHHITRLIRDYLEQIVRYEEQIYFINVPEKYKKLVSLLKDILASQAEKLAEIPVSLDEVVCLIESKHAGNSENPLVIKKEIIFEVPEGWEKQWDKELMRIEDGILTREIGGGCLTSFIIVLVMILIFFGC